MKKKCLAGLAMGLFFVNTVGMANASIVNINARTNTTTNPVVMTLAAGAYDVTPIGVAEGGAYNAWNAWGVVSLPSAGWLNTYSLSSNEFSAFTVGDSVRYATDLQALANAMGTSFTLSSDGNVNFFITDSPYWDNTGGISLNVNPVPIPGAIWFLGSGILSLAVARLKRNDNES